jgi:hypothetical protein
MGNEKSHRTKEIRTLNDENVAESIARAKEDATDNKPQPLAVKTFASYGVLFGVEDSNTFNSVGPRFSSFFPKIALYSRGGFCDTPAAFLGSPWV